MASSISFSYNRQKIAEFSAEVLEFARQKDGILVTASGEMRFQDTALVESLMHHKPSCHVAITKDDETVIDQSFEVSFFTLEPDNLAVLLQ